MEKEIQKPKKKKKIDIDSTMKTQLIKGVNFASFC